MVTNFLTMTEDDYFLSSLVERLMKMTKVTNFLNRKMTGFDMNYQL